MFSPNQFFSQLVTSLEAVEQIAGFRQVKHKIGVEAQVVSFREGANALPPRGAVGDALGAANERDLAVAEPEQMLNRGVGSEFVVDNYRADRSGLQLAANHSGGNVALFQVTKHINVHEKPVR